MRILLHDSAGHSFQADLARELARRGHWVHHVHCDTFLAARGALAYRPDEDPSTLSFGVVSHRRPFSKYRWATRVVQEIEYGVRAARLLRSWKPDVIISCNTPLLSQALMTTAARASGVAPVAWVQDIYSAAAADVVTRLPRPIGFVVSRSLEHIEAGTLRWSRYVVAISDGFVPLLHSWGVHDERLAVVPNWAPIEELPMVAVPTAWARERSLDGCFVFMYTGTLGLKHDPDVLVSLAERFRDRAMVVVVSEGPGRDWIEQQASERQLDNLMVLDYQAVEEYPSVVASADVLVAILTPGSSRYSVPSKVLTYFCAGRPILAIMPDDNDAAVSVEVAKAGFVVPPGDHDAVLDAAERLSTDGDLRTRLGRASRAFAETEFSTSRSADRFEEICELAISRTRPPTSL